MNKPAIEGCLITNVTFSSVVTHLPDTLQILSIIMTALGIIYYATQIYKGWK